MFTVELEGQSEKALQMLFLDKKIKKQGILSCVKDLIICFGNCVKHDLYNDLVFGAVIKVYGNL